MRTRLSSFVVSGVRHTKGTLTRTAVLAEQLCRSIAELSNETTAFPGAEVVRAHEYFASTPHVVPGVPTSLRRRRIPTIRRCAVRKVGRHVRPSMGQDR